MKKRQIVINKDIDEKLGVLCSAALKHIGMEIIDDVNALVDAIKEESVINSSADVS